MSWLQWRLAPDGLYDEMEWVHVFGSRMRTPRVRDRVTEDVYRERSAEQRRLFDIASEAHFADLKAGNEERGARLRAEAEEKWRAERAERAEKEAAEAARRAAEHQQWLAQTAIADAAKAAREAEEHRVEADRPASYDPYAARQKTRSEREWERSTTEQERNEGNGWPSVDAK